MVKPMVHSVKHYVQTSIAAVASGAVLTTDLIHAVTALSVSDPDEVTEGSSVKAVYLELWVRGSATAAASGQLIVYKSVSDAGAPNATDMAALHDWDNKKNILYTTMGLYNDVDADAIAVYKGWIRIPKGKQRFGLGDKLRWTILASGQGINLCGFVTYKEYT